MSFIVAALILGVNRSVINQKAFDDLGRNPNPPPQQQPRVSDPGNDIILRHTHTAHTQTHTHIHTHTHTHTHTDTHTHTHTHTELQFRENEHVNQTSFAIP